jgi:acetone carboxylase gamma subunit
MPHVIDENIYLELKEDEIKTANQELKTIFKLSDEALQKMKELNCLDCGKVCDVKAETTCLLRGVMKDKFMHGNR